MAERLVVTDTSNLFAPRTDEARPPCKKGISQWIVQIVVLCEGHCLGASVCCWVPNSHGMRIEMRILKTKMNCRDGIYGIVHM